MLLVVLGIVGVVVGVPLSISAIATLTNPRRDPEREDRSARAVEPFALGCVVFAILAFAVLIYFGQRW